LWRLPVRLLLLLCVPLFHLLRLLLMSLFHLLFLRCGLLFLRRFGMLLILLLLQLLAFLLLLLVHLIHLLLVLLIGLGVPATRWLVRTVYFRHRRPAIPAEENRPKCPPSLALESLEPPLALAQ